MQRNIVFDLTILLPFPDGVVDDVGVEVPTKGADEELDAMAPGEHVAAVDKLGQGEGQQEYHHVSGLPPHLQSPDFPC